MEIRPSVSIVRRLPRLPFSLRLSHGERWPAGSIVYWSGRSLKEWSPASLEIGVGGAQTAIIHLSRRWAAHGYRVVVYGNIGAHEGQDQGVEYRHFSRFNPADRFDILIAWR